MKVRKPDGFSDPFRLPNSSASGFAAGQSKLSNSNDLEAVYRYEDNLQTTNSIPQGSIVIRGNISPGTNKQQGVAVTIDSSEFSVIITLMMKANPKKTLAAIADSLKYGAKNWPEKHWTVLDN